MEMSRSNRIGENTPCLVVEHLTKAFSGLVAVNDISLSVANGSRRAIIGPNGAGKTTLFNLVTGALEPTQGRIFYQGKDITHTPTHKRAGLGIARTFQITNLFFEMTVSDNILLACQALKKTKFSAFRPAYSYPETMERVMALLKEFALWEMRDEMVKNLSHGDRREIEVVLALASQPRLLLLDEPTAGLSPAETHDMTQFIKGLDPTMTILVIDHDMDVAFELSDEITVLHQGKVLAEGNKNDLKKDPAVQEIYLGASDLQP
jgi:branched-chain amino acid transport system ATP-binding protein